MAGAVAKALEKLPADRFESAKAFAEALANPAYTNATFVGAGTRAASSARSSKRSFIAMSALVASLVGLAAWGWLRPSVAVVSRNRIVLWDTQQLPAGSVGRRLAISPDGGTVVYVDGIGPAAQLYAKDRDRLDATALAGTSGVTGGPTFSPDGAWIAFVSRDGKVKKVPRLGGSAIPIADSALTSFPAIAWLDGGTILYLGSNQGVRAVGQDGGVSRTLLRVAPDSTPRSIRNVAGLPGGKAALLVVCSPLCINSDLRLLDLQSDPPKATVLADQVAAGWPLPGGNVAFVRRDGGVFAAPFDVGRLKFTRPPAPMLDGVRRTGVTVDMVVSANGTAIYVPGAGELSAAVAVEPVWVTRTGVATPIDTAWTVGIPSIGTGDIAKRLALSPDGHRLALSILRAGPGFQHDIWVKQLDQVPLTLTRLTFEDDNGTPAWTQDSRTVVFTSRASMQPGSIRRRRADGTGVVDTLLQLARGLSDVALTRDTTRFVLALNGAPSRDIVRWHRGDSVSSPLMASPSFHEITPALSPDGRWLAYASDESGRLEVYVRTYPDVAGGRWQVSHAGGIAPVWSRSGRELFYQNGAKAFMVAPVRPGATFILGAHVKLFDASGFAGINAGALFYDVAPDDKRFVFFRPAVRASPTAADKLVQVTNWAAEVQAKLAGKAPQ